jgi:1,4-alpha-glucan branching enzyme
MNHIRPPRGSLNSYSAKKVVIPVSFICQETAAKSVSVIGDFNDWSPNANPMKRHVDGTWNAQIPIPHGHHHYLFLIDNKPTIDPRAHGIARNEKGEKVGLLSVS